MRNAHNVAKLPMIMLWSIAQVLGKQFISLVIFTVLSLILKPEDFGLVAMAFVWVAFLDSFSETGFSSALIQRQNVNTQHFSSVFVLNVGVGVLLAICGAGLAYPAALIFDTPLMQPLITVLSLGFIVNALSLTQVALAQKKLHFRDLFIRDTIATIVGGIVGISAALGGAGAWSLVMQTLVTYTVSAITLWSLSSWRPHWHEIRWSAITELWSYSSKLFIFNFLKFFAQNVDKFFISIFLGATAIGIYSFAFRWTSLPITMFVGAIGTYLFPHYAAMQTDRLNVKKSYLQILRITNALILPILLTIAIIAPLAIPLFWKDKWLGAIPVIQSLCLLAYAQTFISPLGQLHKAFNKPGWLVWWTIWTTLAIVLGLPFAILLWDILGVSLVLVAVYCLSLPISYFSAKHLIDLSLNEIIRGLVPSLLAGFIMAMIMLLLMKSPVEPVLKLVMVTVLGASTYAAVLWRADQALIRWVWSESLSRLRPKKSSL